MALSVRQLENPALLNGLNTCPFQYRIDSFSISSKITVPDSRGATAVQLHHFTLTGRVVALVVLSGLVAGNDKTFEIVDERHQFRLEGCL